MSSRKRGRADDESKEESIVEPPAQKRRLARKEQIQFAKRVMAQEKAEMEAKQAELEGKKVKPTPNASSQTAAAKSPPPASSAKRPSKAERAALAKQLLANDYVPVATSSTLTSNKSKRVPRAAKTPPRPSPKKPFQSPKPPPRRVAAQPPQQQRQEQEPLSTTAAAIPGSPQSSFSDDDETPAPSFNAVAPATFPQQAPVHAEMPRVDPPPSAPHNFHPQIPAVVFPPQQQQQQQPIQMQHVREHEEQQVLFADQRPAPSFAAGAPTFPQQAPVHAEMPRVDPAPSASLNFQNQIPAAVLPPQQQQTIQMQHVHEQQQQQELCAGERPAFSFAAVAPTFPQQAPVRADLPRVEPAPSASLNLQNQIPAVVLPPQQQPIQTQHVHEQQQQQVLCAPVPAVPRVHQQQQTFQNQQFLMQQLPDQQVIPPRSQEQPIQQQQQRLVQGQMQQQLANPSRQAVYPMAPANPLSRHQPAIGNQHLQVPVQQVTPPRSNHLQSVQQQLMQVMQEEQEKNQARREAVRPLVKTNEEEIALQSSRSHDTIFEDANSESEAVQQEQLENYVVVDDESLIEQQDFKNCFTLMKWIKPWLGVIAVGVLAFVCSSYNNQLHKQELGQLELSDGGEMTPCFLSFPELPPEAFLSTFEDESDSVTFPAHCPSDLSQHMPCPPHAVCKGGSIVSCESNLWVPKSHKEVSPSTSASNNILSPATHCALSEDADFLVSAVLQVLEKWSLPRICNIEARPAASHTTVGSLDMPMYSYDLIVQELNNKPYWAQKFMEKEMNPAVHPALFQSLAEGRVLTSSVVDDDAESRMTLWVGLLPEHQVPFPLDCMIVLAIGNGLMSIARFLFTFAWSCITYVFNIAVAVFWAYPFTTLIVVVAGSAGTLYFRSREKRKRAKRQLDVDTGTVHRCALEILKKEKEPLRCLALRDATREQLRLEQQNSGSSIGKNRFNNVVWPIVQSRLERDQRVDMLFIQGEAALEWVGPRAT